MIRPVPCICVIVVTSLSNVLIMYPHSWSCFFLLSVSVFTSCVSLFTFLFSCLSLHSLISLFQYECGNQQHQIWKAISSTRGGLATERFDSATEPLPGSGIRPQSSCDGIRHLVRRRTGTVVGHHRGRARADDAISSCPRSAHVTAASTAGQLLPGHNAESVDVLCP